MVRHIRDVYSGNIWAKDVLAPKKILPYSTIVLIRFEILLLITNIVVVVIRHNTLDLKNYVFNAISLVVISTSMIAFCNDNSMFEVSSYFFMGGLLHCREVRRSPLSYGTFEYVIVTLKYVNKSRLFGLILWGDIVNQKTSRHKRVIRLRGWDTEVFDNIIDYCNECRVELGMN